MRAFQQKSEARFRTSTKRGPGRDCSNMTTQRRKKARTGIVERARQQHVALAGVSGSASASSHHRHSAKSLAVDVGGATDCRRRCRQALTQLARDMTDARYTLRATEASRNASPQRSIRIMRRSVQSRSRYAKTPIRLRSLNEGFSSILRLANGHSPN